MANECIFCCIAAGEVPCDIVYQYQDFVAFRDIEPQAPVHILVIPRIHVSSLLEITEQQHHQSNLAVRVPHQVCSVLG